MARSRNRQQLSDDMLQAGRALGNASAMLNHAVAEHLGVHPTDWECLSLLFEFGPVTAGRLAELTGLTTGAITGLIDRLEASGYVRRQRVPEDRRRVIVELVPSRMSDVMPVFAPMLTDMVALHARYTPEQMAMVVEALEDAGDVLRHHAHRIRAEAAGRKGHGSRIARRDGDGTR
ncbi:MAG: MarR family winged helix-turn-helix transcriptional regulator, partial [Acidimicrobiales bacterium]